MFWTCSSIILSASIIGSICIGDGCTATGSGSKFGSSALVTIGSCTFIFFVAVCELTGSVVNPDRNRF